jgi:hypothetical protein
MVSRADLSLFKQAMQVILLAIICFLATKTSIGMTIRWLQELRSGEDQVMFRDIGWLWELSKLVFIPIGMHYLIEHGWKNKVIGSWIFASTVIVTLGSMVASTSYLVLHDHRHQLGSASKTFAYTDAQKSVARVEADIARLQSVAQQDEGSKKFRYRAYDAQKDINALRAQRDGYAAQIKNIEAHPEDSNHGDFFTTVARVLGTTSKDLRVTSQVVVGVMIDIIALIAITLLSFRVELLVDSINDRRGSSQSKPGAEAIDLATIRARRQPELTIANAASMAATGTDSAIPNNLIPNVTVPDRKVPNRVVPKADSEGRGDTGTDRHNSRFLNILRDIYKDKTKPVYDEVQTKYEVSPNTVAKFFRTAVAKGALKKEGRRYVRGFDDISQLEACFG